MNRFLPMVLFWGAFSFAEDVHTFVLRGMQQHPLFQEAKFKEKLSLHETKSANLQAILPKFSATVAFGPAPGIRQGVDTVMINGVAVAETNESYDFTNLGSYFATQVELIQPLNFGRLTVGNRALQAQHQVELAQIHKDEIEFTRELQELYYGYLLAKSTNELVGKAHKDFNRALEDTEEKLEDGKISQFEFLEMQAELFGIEDGLYQAEEGLKKAESNLAFLFPEENPKDIFGADSFIVKRPEKMPSLDQFIAKANADHPDLQRLNYGLEALADKASLSASEMGPEFFFFGKVEYTKSWARDREDQGNSVFSQDPLNKIEGALGIGARLNLNFWARNHKRVESRLEYKQLKFKENYAKSGIQLKVREAWLLVERHKKRLASVQGSLEATEAWLQGKATQFDLDPSVAKDLMKAYSKNATMKKNFYFVLYDYNIAVAKLIATAGMTLAEFNEWNSTL